MKLMTISEASRALDVPKCRIERGVKSGKYPSMRWMSRRLVDVETLARIFAEEEAAKEDRVGIRQLSELTGLPTATLRRMCRAGLIPGQQDKNKRYIFSVTEVMEAIQKLME